MAWFVDGLEKMNPSTVMVLKLCLNEENVVASHEHFFYWFICFYLYNIVAFQPKNSRTLVAHPQKQCISSFQLLDNMYDLQCCNTRKRERMQINERNSIYWTRDNSYPTSIKYVWPKILSVYSKAQLNTKKRWKSIYSGLED